jgi:2-polyprenyl-6-methoxyphenol hydroxylase-like FAD-dependent oxidoreductase
MKIIIIGGGIGGLTTAMALSKLGADVQVYERAPELREVGAGIALASNAIRALDVLGLGATLQSSSVGGMQGAIRGPKGNVLTAVSADLFKELGSVAIFHRAELLALLARHVDPARLHLGRRFVGFEQSGGAVTARFDSGESIRGDALIGADGLRSDVRTQLFGNHAIRYAGYTGWRAVTDFSADADVPPGETWGHGRRFGIVPMNRGRVY